MQFDVPIGGSATDGMLGAPSGAIGQIPTGHIGFKSMKLSHKACIDPFTHLQTQAASARSAKHTRITKAITARIASLLQMASRKGTISSRRMHDDQPQLLLHVKQ